MAEFCYRYHGLCVHSEFQIGEWASFEAAEASSDVRVSLDSDFDADLTPSEKGEYRFFVADVGWFRVKSGSEIVVANGDFAVSRKLRLFLIGAAWGALLYQRGLFPLHASAVHTDRGAVLFCGRRGHGKSTLAAFLVERGYQLISDDLCRVRMTESGEPVVYPSLPVVKLWSDSVQELGWKPPELVPGQFRPEKFHCPQPSPLFRHPLPLKAVYLLCWGDSGFDRLGGFSALNRFFNAATWRGELLDSAGDPAEYFRHCTELVGRVPIWEFRRPREFRVFAENTDLLIDHIERDSVGVRP